MTTPATELIVEFEGVGEGSVALTWGQQTIWIAIQRLGEQRFYFNLRRIVRVDSLQLDTVVSALRTLVEEHQGLRTHFIPSSDGPMQQIFARGRFAVEIVEAVDDASAASDAAVLMNTHGDRPFGPGDWPWRCGIVTRAGKAEYLSLVLDHQAVDGTAAVLVLTALSSLLAGGDIGETTWQPLDQVAYETEGEGVQRNALSLRYWSRQLSLVPQSMFDMLPREPEADRFWKIGITSPAAAVAATRIAARTGRTTSAVLLAASSTVLMLLTEHRTAVMQLIVANRFDARRRSLIAALYEDGLFVVEADGVQTFDALVEATYRSALSTYRYGFYDRVQRDTMIADIEAERGAPIELMSFFNDTRINDAWSQIPNADTPAQLAAMTARTDLEIVGTWAHQDSTYFLAVAERPDACRLTLLVDTAYITPDETKAALIALEAVLVAAAFEDVPLEVVAANAGVEPIPRNAA